MGAVVVEVDRLAARRARQGVRTGRDRRERQATHVRRARIAVWPAVAHHAAICLAQDGQLVRLRVVVAGRVRLVGGRRGCGDAAAAAVATAATAAAAAGRRVAAVLLRYGRFKRPLRVHGAIQAHGVVTRQQNGVVE